MVGIVVKIIISLVFLYFGARCFIKSSVDIAFYYHVRPYLISMTVIAFATSMPELVTSCLAQYQIDNADVALGNVIGSNIANIGLVLGLSALFFPISVLKEYRRNDFLHLFLSSIILAFFLYWGKISRWGGALLLLCFLLIYAYQIVKGKKHISDKEIKILSIKKDLLILFIALFALLLGADLLLKQGIEIGSFFSISERIIGLSIVAVGTSIPELAISLVAAIEKKGEISLGNVIGSNLFNTLFIVAIASFVRPMVFSSSFFSFDLPCMLFFTLFLWLMTFFCKQIYRLQGALLLCLYFGYLIMLFS